MKGAQLQTEVLIACLNVATRWQLNSEVLNQLLGATVTSGKDMKFDLTTLSEAVEIRCTLVLEIDKCLHVLFPDEAANSWVNRSNSTYGGNTALQHMMSVGEPALREVLNYLRAVIYT